MKIKKKFKYIVRLKFSQTSNKIMKLTFANCFTIKLLPIKRLTEVMLHWNLQLNIIWDCW